MSTNVKQETTSVKARQYIVDSAGNKVAAIIDIEELNRLGGMLKNIPSSEAWLYQNNKAFESVQRGLKNASEGKVSKLNLDEL